MLQAYQRRARQCSALTLYRPLRRSLKSG